MYNTATKSSILESIRVIDQIKGYRNVTIVFFLWNFIFYQLKPKHAQFSIPNIEITSFLLLLTLILLSISISFLNKNHSLGVVLTKISLITSLIYFSSTFWFFKSFTISQFDEKTTFSSNPIFHYIYSGFFCLVILKVAFDLNKLVFKLKHFNNTSDTNFSTLRKKLLKKHTEHYFEFVNQGTLSILYTLIFLGIIFTVEKFGHHMLPIWLFTLFITYKTLNDRFILLKSKFETEFILVKTFTSKLGSKAPNLDTTIKQLNLYRESIEIRGFFLRYHFSIYDLLETPKYTNRKRLIFRTNIIGIPQRLEFKCNELDSIFIIKHCSPVSNISNSSKVTSP